MPEGTNYGTLIRRGITSASVGPDQTAFRPLPSGKHQAERGAQCRFTRLRVRWTPVAETFCPRPEPESCSGAVFTARRSARGFLVRKTFLYRNYYLKKPCLVMRGSFSQHVILQTLRI